MSILRKKTKGTGEATTQRTLIKFVVHLHENENINEKLPAACDDLTVFVDQLAASFVIEQPQEIRYASVWRGEYCIMFSKIDPWCKLTTGDTLNVSWPYIAHPANWFVINRYTFENMPINVRLTFAP